MKGDRQKGMKANKSQLFGVAPQIGSEYIKLKNGSICLWSSFDPKTQMLEYVALDGTIRQVQRRDVELPTGNEVVDFLRSKQIKPRA